MSESRGGEFKCLVAIPAGLEHCGAALAAARAGGVGILDFEYVAAADRARAIANLGELLDKTPDTGRVGVRGREADVEALFTEHRELVATLGWVIVADPDSGRTAPEFGAAKILASVCRSQEVNAFEAASGWHAVVVRAQELGGEIGRESTYMACQELHRTAAVDWYLHGAVGVHSAAACRLAGAAGVVVDDQILLMPESPLPATWQRHLERVSSTDCVELGAALGGAIRVLVRPGMRGAQRLAAQEDSLDAEPHEDGGAHAEAVFDAWKTAVDDGLAWSDPGKFAWPAGQAASMAASLRDRYGSVGRLVQEMLRNSEQHLVAAAEDRSLASGGALAADHGTEFPVVQGPMTRVSDVPEFADAVATAGALPMTALALLPKDACDSLLSRTSELVGDRPWGVGILGFVPPELRAEQAEAIRAARPPFALVAGGRPDQVLELQNEGIDTYVHVPVPTLLPMFLDRGVRRFVFEGRECGGHVGPLCSLQLWDMTVEALADVDDETCGELCLLFAGGIHDEMSAAMVAAIAAPLTARGARIGVLMGTAYLFTDEAVSSGAIVADYQQVAMDCRETVSLSTAVGHANRCAETPFADEFVQERRRLRGAGADPDEIRDRLEDLTLGRLRIATKGTRRDEEGNFEDVAAEERARSGMYMLGEVAARRSERLTMRNLHEIVSDGATSVLESLRSPTIEAVDAAPDPVDIAIVGMAARFPGAADVGTLWRNLVAKRSAIEEIPERIWDRRLYYKDDGSRGDYSVSKWGGFMDDFRFEPLDYGIPPNSMPTIAPSQLMALQLTREALQDAGWSEGAFDKDETAVIVACSDAGGMLGHLLLARSLTPLALAGVDYDDLDRLPEWTQEAFTGVLGNVVAGRVANRFDLGGPSFIIDSACASSLSAVDMAVQELASGRSNAAVVGGVDVTQTPYQYLAFTNTQALSPTGQARTFDKKADGIVTSDGGAILVLKRLADAERDGDQIHAVIKAVGASSDGRALGMTAPRPLGQRRALDRAYSRAGFNARAIDLYEAHGTGTKVGDQAELETINGLLEESGAEPASCVVGSAKSLIGHAKTAAGMAGLVKCIMALREGVLPPHGGVDEPLDPLLRDESPAYLLQEAKPWLRSESGPRRAAVSAFGFGGTNAHVVLEEYGDVVPARRPGGDAWPAELLTVWARDRGILKERLTGLHEAIRDGAEPNLAELAATLAETRDFDDTGALATLVVDSRETLQECLEAALAGLESGNLTPRVGVRLTPQWNRQRGETAFVFPGQGSQRVDMARELALYLPELRDALSFGDRVLEDSCGSISRIIYPPAAFSDDARRAAEQALTDTRIAQPALGVVSTGMLDVCRSLGLNADMMAGHSYGELTALHAAGAMSREALLVLSAQRGAAMASVAEPGTMAVVHAGAAAVAALLPHDVVVANENAPAQTVISGSEAGVAQALESLNDEGMVTSRLPVAAAFHSHLMADAADAFRTAAEAAIEVAPTLPVYSNSDGAPFPPEVAQTASRLVANLTGSVRFVSQIRSMYEDGARVFVEVGPGSVLSGLVGQILEGSEHTAVSLGGHGGMRGMLTAFGELLGSGVTLDLAPLYAGRAVPADSLTQLLERSRPAAPSATTWIVNSVHSRPHDTETRVYGKEALLTADSTAAAAAVARQRHGVESASAAAAPASVAAEGQPDARLRAYQAYQETMRQFLRTQEHIVSSLMSGGTVPAGMSMPTLEDFTETPVSPPAAAPAAPVAAQDSVPDTEDAGAATDVAAAVPEVEVAEASVAEAIEVAEGGEVADEHVALEEGALADLLVELVAERTGYPPEMLGADLDVEAELGVDSIKRLEVLDKLLQRLPASLSAVLSQDMDRVGRAKTLNAIAKAVLLAAEEMESAPPEAIAVEPVAVEVTVEPVVEPEHEETCPRFVVGMQEEPLSGVEFGGLSGIFLVTHDDAGIAEVVARDLEARGAIPVTVPIDVCGDQQTLHRYLEREIGDGGTVRGILHLAPLSSAAMPTTSRTGSEPPIAT